MRRFPLPLLPASLRWAGVLVVGAVIFYFSLITLPPATVDAAKPGPPDLIPLDKWRHFLAYFAFAGALAYAITDSDRPGWQLALLVVGTTALYGFGIELGQSTLPDRYFGLGDAWANIIGALLVLPWFAIRRRLEPLPVQRLVGLDDG